MRTLKVAQKKMHIVRNHEDMTDSKSENDVKIAMQA